MRSEPEKIAKLIHDLYVLLPAIEEHGTDESISKHLKIIEHYMCKHDEAVIRWNFPRKAS